MARNQAPEKTREEELAEVVRLADEEIADLEARAAACAQHAQELTVQRAEELAKSQPDERRLRELRHAMADAEQDLEDYRARAQLRRDAAAGTRAEHEQLRRERDEAELRAAQAAEREELLAELAEIHPKRLSAERFVVWSAQREAAINRRLGALSPSNGTPIDQRTGRPPDSVSLAGSPRIGPFGADQLHQAAGLEGR